MDKKEISDKLSKIIQISKKELKQIQEETPHVFKKCEELFKDFTIKSESVLKDAQTVSKNKLEIYNKKIKRERLYYDLGKKTAHTAKNRIANNNQIEQIIDEIRKINREIKKAEKK